jgi:hypothetical protein
LSFSFNPSITVGRSYNMIREMLNVLLGVLVVECSSNKSLSSKKGMFRVSDSLYNNKNRKLTYRLAGTPTSRWPSSVNATMDGVVLMPRSKRLLTFSIFNNTWIVSFHHGHTGVGRPQINSDDLPGLIPTYANPLTPLRTCKVSWFFFKSLVTDPLNMSLLFNN